MKIRVLIKRRDNPCLTYSEIFLDFGFKPESS